MSLTQEDKDWFKGEILAVATRVDEVATRVETLDARLDAVAARVEEVASGIERVETSLLTEFHKWASPMEMRLRSHSAVLRALDADFDLLSDRVRKLEGTTRPRTITPDRPVQKISFSAN
jgi:hypothetical protein